MQAVVIQNLKKVYQNGVIALKGIDLTVEEGEFFALLGPNGAGKSTAIGIVSSLINKSSGTVNIFGHDLDQHPSRAKRLMGLVPQEFNFSMFERVIDIIVNQAGYYGLPRKQALGRAEFYLKKLGLWEKRDQVSRMLSGGMKRRLMIVRGLIHEPKILILDEPTSGVDIEHRHSMWEFLKDLNRQGITIILTTHYLEEAEALCKELAIIHKGEIIADTSIKELLSKLSKQSFILDLQKPLSTLPNWPGYTMVAIDDSSLEVTLPKGKSLNELFQLLNQEKITVVSLRNKSSRLEQLFLELVKEDSGVIA